MRPPNPVRLPSRIFVAVVLTVALFGAVAVVGAGALSEQGVPAEQIRGTTASEDPVPVENGSVYWRGQRLAFSVESDDAYELRNADGELVAQVEPATGTASVDTADLSPGEYVLSSASNDSVAYRFEVARQSLSAAASSDGVEVVSNRMSYPLAVDGANLSTDQLLSLFPDAVVRNGTVAFTDVGTTETLTTDPSGVPDGEYDLTLRVRDADATASVSLSVSSPETRRTTSTSETATTETATGTVETTPAETATGTGVPGFGVSAALLAFAVALGAAAVGRQ